MDTWFLDNLEKLVPIVIALLYFLGTSKAKKSAEAEGVPDPKADERARKIQEEIRRKILERQQRGNVPIERQAHPELPTLEDAQPLPPNFERSYREEAEVEVFPGLESNVPPPEPRQTNPLDFYEEQRKEIEEQVRKTREFAERARLADVGTAYARPMSKEARSDMDRMRYAKLWDDLDDPESLRRAIVLKEILDVPVALR